MCKESNMSYHQSYPIHEQSLTAFLYKFAVPATTRKTAQVILRNHLPRRPIHLSITLPISLLPLNHLPTHPLRTQLIQLPLPIPPQLLQPPTLPPFQPFLPRLGIQPLNFLLILILNLPKSVVVAENTILAFVVFDAADGNAAVAGDGDGTLEEGAAG